MLLLAAASGEMLRVVDCLAAPIACASDGRGGGAAESGWRRAAVSVKPKRAPGTRRERLIGRIQGGTERAQVLAQVSLSASTAAAVRKKRAAVVKAPHAVQTSVATIETVTESNVCTDVSVEKALALARAAAKAARDAAAYAEAQRVGEESEKLFPSELLFPSEQDLLLLERARLTEMARTGAVPSSSPPETVNGDRAASSSQWGTVSGYSASSVVESDLASGANVAVSSLDLLEPEQDVDDQEAAEEGQQEEEEEEEQDTRGESARRRQVDITVRSSRRKERIMKRERALLKAEMNASSPVIPAPLKAKKAQASYDASDPVRAYLRDISKTKLLTAAQEVVLAEGIQDLLRIEAVKAELAEQMGREPSLYEWAKAVGAEHQSLESRIKSGQACKDKMVNSNLRLVVSIAKRYQGRGMTIQDLIQEGSMGLIRGAEKFDHTKGFKFSTYAHWWIRQAITRAIADQSRTIRLPVHVYELLSRITKAKSMLSSEHGRVPKDEEVAELVGLNIDKLKLIVKSSKNPKSLEFPIGKDKDTMLGEVIADKDFESPEEAITKRLLKQDLNTVLNTLNPRERDVLKLRYGLDDGRMRTLEEIGNVFNVTRERIRQIEAKALRKLRQPTRNTSLREYLDLKP